MTTESPLLESQLSQLDRAAVDTGPNTGPLAGPLNGAKLHLGMSNLAIGPNTTYADLSGQEADFTGYAAEALTWDAPSVAADGTVEVVCTPVVFRASDGVSPNAIYNAWISNAGSSAWYFAGVIVGGPVPFDTADSQMVVTLRFRPATQSLAVCTF